MKKAALGAAFFFEKALALCNFLASGVVEVPLVFCVGVFYEN
jgi:hypothetical protein